MKFNIHLLLGFLALLFCGVSGYWRMPCMGVVGRGQIDPIVSPGEVSAHLHTIKGGSAISLNSSVEDLLSSRCTSCQIAQDKSAYWTPQLYFYDSDKNEFEMVQEVSGHLSYYKYVPHFVADGTYTMPIAIPNGMKMLSGDPFRRNFTLQEPDPPLPWTGEDATQAALRQKAIGFNCLNYAAQPEGSLQRHFLPNKTFLETQCPDGIRLEVLFPTCWNGRDLAPKDLTSHLAYGNAGLNGGACPEDFNTVIMQLFFETIYPTTGFIGRNGYFTLANGDPTGFGYHGDAMIAWQGTAQEDAVRECGNPDPRAGAQAQDGVVEHCNVFSTVAVSDMSQCTMQETQLGIIANFVAMSTSLPGINPIQFGPEEATHATGVSAPVVTALPSSVGAQSISVAPRTSDTTNPYANQFLQGAGTFGAISPSSTLISTTSSIPATVTPPPVVPAQLPAGEQILNTVTYTSNGAVYEVVNVEIVQTTTVLDEARKRKRAEHFRYHQRPHQHD